MKIIPIDEEEIRKLSSLDKEKFEAAILYAAAQVNVDVKKWFCRYFGGEVTKHENTYKTCRDSYRVAH